jgi:hypothetical protein
MNTTRALHDINRGFAIPSSTAEAEVPESSSGQAQKLSFAFAQESVQDDVWGKLFSMQSPGWEMSA